MIHGMSKEQASQAAASASGAHDEMVLTANPGAGKALRIRITELLAQPANLLAAVTKKDKRFIGRIKHRSDLEIAQKNRNELPEELARKSNRNLESD
jgi:hypothetical protein